MRIELHYGTGGHGGPYFGEANALEGAVRLLKGCHNERRIDLRNEVSGPLVATVEKTTDRDGFVCFVITRPAHRTEYRRFDR